MSDVVVVVVLLEPEDPVVLARILLALGDASNERVTLTS